MQKLLFALILTCCSWGNLSANALTEAQRLFEAGQPDQAMSKLNDYLSSQPGSAEARFLKGLILVEQGDSRGAIAAFTSITKDYPELPEPYNNIAVIHAANGDYERARTALQSALRTHPSYATAYENLGDIYAKMASEAYQQALDLEKQDKGKLKVKLSLIGNLFLGESKPLAVASVEPVVDLPATHAIVEEPEPARPAQPVIANNPVAVELEPIAKPVKRSPVTGQESSLRKAINLWSLAWSAQDVDAYLSYYADTFKPAKGSYAQWKDQRRVRLAKPAFIRVSLENIKFAVIAEKSASIELTQIYESNTYQDKSRKRFDMVLVNGQWKIDREVSI